MPWESARYKVDYGLNSGTEAGVEEARIRQALKRQAFDPETPPRKKPARTRAPPSTVRQVKRQQNAQAVTKKQRKAEPSAGTKQGAKVAIDWDKFIADAEDVVGGKIIQDEAGVEPGVAVLREAVEKDFTSDRYEKAAEEVVGSVAACGKKKTVTRAIICLLVSTSTGVKTSAAAQVIPIHTFLSH